MNYRQKKILQKTQKQTGHRIQYCQIYCRSLLIGKYQLTWNQSQNIAQKQNMESELVRSDRSTDASLKKKEEKENGRKVTRTNCKVI